MQHFPIFLATPGARVVVAGAGPVAVAKLRLLLKTQAELVVFGTAPAHQIRDWHAAGRLKLVERPLSAADVDGARLVYAAADDPAEDARVAGLARAAGALVNIVDNLADSDFITPAIVDRDPVTVAIGTEGAAPVLARDIKRRLEELLPATLGPLARIGQAFRARAEALPAGRVRRAFWSAFYFGSGPLAQSEGRAEAALEDLLDSHLAPAAQTAGRVDLVGAGPGDPDLMTLKARKLLHEADVVIHDALVPGPILELARREAEIVEAGKRGFRGGWAQDDINALMIDHARTGAHVVRLKSGDPGIFGRLEEEALALDAAGIDWSIVPGITAASAAAAAIGQPLTRRGSARSVRFLTAHDINGFAEADWRALAAPGAVAAIYMGKRAARFLQGRLLMHGAARALPVTVVENASRPDQVVRAASLIALTEAVEGLDGPAVILLGMAPRAAARTLETLQEELA